MYIVRGVLSGERENWETPQMFKKSGINKGNAMNYLAVIVGIFHVCTEKQSAVNPRDSIDGKEEPALIEVN